MASSGANPTIGRINGTVIDLLYYEFVNYLWQQHEVPSHKSSPEEDQAPRHKDTDELKQEASGRQEPSASSKEPVAGSGDASGPQQGCKQAPKTSNIYDRLQEAGCATGRKLAQLHTARQSEGEKGGPQSMNDVMRFIGRDIWRYLHSKQIDYLSTNSKGLWKLIDQEYSFLKYVSAPVGEDSRKGALIYLIYPCGVIQGVLEMFGVEARVNADVSALPKCCFHVEIAEEKQRAKEKQAS